ncbi:unnamed protein product [Cuscuta epithymum]|uniref:Reverse transcriptase zinc-binding domain-containing protein n=1 Tax=Cuscuta epithymum TaxID=186058 RepID=A0AAV0G396_9ASTE|nr:unnamed protein product [Cuscuta epithymum]
MKREPIESIWKNFWDLSIPPKLKHFLWRLVSGCLATKEHLWRRKATDDPTCPVCAGMTEDISHMLFFCKFSSQLWKNEIWGNLVMVAPTMSAKELLGWAMKNLSQGIYSFIINCWAAWRCRNKVVFEQKEPQVELIRMGCNQYIEDFQTYASKVYKGPESYLNNRPEKWNKPSFGFVKANCDAAVFKGGGVGL